MKLFFISEIMKRIAVLDSDLCKPKKCGHECMKACPVNRKGEECINIPSGKETPVLKEGICIGCALCCKRCPFKAWSVVNLPAALKESPVHRFGENQFALFRLPIPVKGVVGLLGANGTGKSTALKILSGHVTPNLGDVQSGVRPAGSQLTDLIRLHRGSEMQDYLEKIEKGRIKVSYKPQNISALAQISKGVDDISIDEQLFSSLGISGCRGRNLGELSGGELQRVAIAAAMTKEADIYYFDEPTSYLDVHHRLSVAKSIRSLAEEKYVMVVEHDLATLDFLADRIHIFYGEPGVFGVVSKPYAVKKGINAFLDGFVAEDNMRIRERTVFEEVAPEAAKKKKILVSFEDIHKSYENFGLKISSGELCENEVLGIFGPNALGKTTFAKILAGEISFSGSISKKIKVSYKPQYITADFSGKLSELLSSADNDVAMKLGLEKLMEKNLKNLSGGELQRAAIALCLSHDADLYLLDEPSAFLDVDQRLAVAKLLRSQPRTFAVIDHDLLFLSYVAGRAMLFSGVPGSSGSAEFLALQEGFNKFLKGIDVTFRLDPENKRPRANKPGSLNDREQKERNEYFFRAK